MGLVDTTTPRPTGTPAIGAAEAVARPTPERPTVGPTTAAVRTVADARANPVTVAVLAKTTPTSPPDATPSTVPAARHAAPVTAKAGVSHATKAFRPLAEAVVPSRTATAARTTTAKRARALQAAVARKDLDFLY